LCTSLHIPNKKESSCNEQQEELSFLWLGRQLRLRPSRLTGVVYFYLTKSSEFRKPVDLFLAHQHLWVVRDPPEEVCSSALEYTHHEKVGHALQFAVDVIIPTWRLAGLQVLWRVLNQNEINVKKR
jgi:hypothetical protein